MLGWEWSGCLPKLSAVFQAGAEDVGHSDVDEVLCWWPETLSEARVKPWSAAYNVNISVI